METLREDFMKETVQELNLMIQFFEKLSTRIYFCFSGKCSHYLFVIANVYLSLTLHVDNDRAAVQ